MLDVQFFEKVVPFLKDARTLTVLLAFKRFPVISIDSLQYSLK